MRGVRRLRRRHITSHRRWLRKNPCSHHERGNHLQRIINEARRFVSSPSAANEAQRFVYHHQRSAKHNVSSTIISGIRNKTFRLPSSAVYETQRFVYYHQPERKNNKMQNVRILKCALSQLVNRQIVSSSALLLLKILLLKVWVNPPNSFFCSRFCSWKSESTHQTRSSAQDSALESLSQPTKLVLLLKILLLKVWVNLPNSFFFSRFCSWKSESTYQTRRVISVPDHFHGPGWSYWMILPPVPQFWDRQFVSVIAM